MCVGEYLNGQPKGIWLFFNNGDLTRIVTNIKTNSSVVDTYGRQAVPKYSGHIVYINHNCIVLQGIVFFDEIVELVEHSKYPLKGEDAYCLKKEVEKSGNYKRFIVCSSKGSDDIVTFGSNGFNSYVSIENKGDKRALYDFSHGQLACVFDKYMKYQLDSYYNMICYCRGFYVRCPQYSGPNYCLGEEGSLLFNKEEGPETDLSLNFGIIKRYNGDGVLASKQKVSLNKQKEPDVPVGYIWIEKYENLPLD